MKKIRSTILGWAWLLTGFVAIWTPKEIGFKLFMTGLFALAVGILSIEPKDK